MIKALSQSKWNAAAFRSAVPFGNGVATSLQLPASAATSSASTRDSKDNADEALLGRLHPDLQHRFASMAAPKHDVGSQNARRRRSSELKNLRNDARRGSVLKAHRLSFTKEMKHGGALVDLPPPPDDVAARGGWPQGRKGAGGKSGKTRWRELSTLVHAVNAERNQHGVNYRAKLVQEVRSGIIAFVVMSATVAVLVG